MNHIGNGGDPNEFEQEEQETEQQEEQLDVNDSMTREQLVLQLQNMKQLKEYAIKKNNRSLVHSTEMTIRELEWHLSGSWNLVQPAMTNFFRRSSHF